MRPLPFVIGLGLTILILAAALFSPVFRSSQRKQTTQAQEQAVLALRQLGRVSPTLMHLEALADTEQLGDKQDALGTAADGARERLEELNREFSQALRRAQQQAEEAGLPTPEERPPAASGAGVRQALSGFNASVQENRQLLSAAKRVAQEAVRTQGTALGVAHVEGMAHYLEAADLLLRAKQERIEQREAQRKLLRSAAQWKEDQGEYDHYRSLDVAPILEQLEQDLVELRERRNAAEQRVTELEQLVEQRQLELTGDGSTAGVEQRMQDVRQELLRLERRGFAAGAEAGTAEQPGFGTYREQYLQLSQQLQELQAREQLLRNGGLRDAQFVGEDALTAELEGGERVVGLEEYERKLALARDVAERLRSANVSLEEHIAFLEEMSASAGESVTRFQQRMEEMEGTQRALIEEEIPAHAAAAYELEAKALQAAGRAVSSFSRAQSAAQNWMNEVQRVRREQDPQQKNERLRLIVGDDYFQNVSRSAEAAARLLAGRAYAQQIEANTLLLSDMQTFRGLNPSPQVQFDERVFQGHIDTARPEGRDTVQDAIRTYEQIAGSLRGQPTEWVPLAGKAAAHYLLSRIDPAIATEQRNLALDAMQQAVEGRENFPYVEPYLPFRNYLSGAGPSAPAAEAPAEEGFFLEEEPSDEGDAEPTDEGGGDFFLD